MITETIDASSYPANGKPVLGEQAAAQSVNLPFPAGGSPFAGMLPGMTLLGPGGSFLNPLNFPGWRGYYPGYTWVYDWMLRHPRIQQANAILTAPILQSSWNFECDEKDNRAVKGREKIKSNWTNLRPEFMPDALRGIHYGCAKFEPVWDKDSDGDYIIEKMKPLDVDRTGIHCDHGGTFTGFSVALRTDLDDYAKKYLNTVKGGPTLPAALGKAWLYTFDKKNGYLHGRSILENMRETAWIPWLTTAQQLILLGGKVSGRQAAAIVPAGEYTDPATGQPRTYWQDAYDAMLSWLEGKCPVFRSIAVEAIDKMGAVDPALKIKLLTETLVKFQVIDFGNLGPAIDAKIKELDKYEDLIFAGYFLSSRTGMESKHGSRADSEQHTETGSTNSQIVGNSIAEQLQPLIDYQCKINWNLPARTVRIKQALLRDTSAEQAVDQIEKLCAANPAIATAVYKAMDKEKQFAAARIPVKANVDFDALLDESQQPPAAMAKPEEKDSPVVQMSRAFDALMKADFDGLNAEAA